MFCRICITEALVLSVHGRAKTNPVAASTAVHIATWPALDLGMLRRSIWIRSPDSFAVGCNVSNGTLVYLWGGLVLAHVSHDLQKLSVSVAMPSQYQYSCNRRKVYGADV